MRSAIFGAILAVTVVVATVTFGSSLNTLVSHPALYGWNWTYDMDGGGGLGDVPGQAAAKLLDADPLVQAWTGVSYSTLQLDGINVPVLGTTPGAAVAPPLLSGHEPRWGNQVVLGAATLRAAAQAASATRWSSGHTGAPGHPDDRGHGHTAADRRHGLLAPRDGHGAVLSYRLIPAGRPEPLRNARRAPTRSWSA